MIRNYGSIWGGVKGHGRFWAAAFALRVPGGTLPAAMTMTEQPKIIAYLKPTCGWSNGVRAILRKYDLAYEDRDIIGNPQLREEMVRKSGQTLSPCVEVNGRMLADISGDEVEAFLLEQRLLSPTNRVADAPTHACCGG